MGHHRFVSNDHAWAVANVGRYWNHVLDGREVFDLTTHIDLPFLPRRMRGTVWGYSTLHTQWVGDDKPLARRFGRGWLQAELYRPRWHHEQLTVVHDPCELYPQAPDWRSREPALRHLRQYSRVAVTSAEMVTVLAEHGISAYVINTNSMLPLRAADLIEPDAPLRAFTRARPYPRKNLAQFDRLAAALAPNCDTFYRSDQPAPAAEADYITDIDAHNVYVCTSWQEGGPLPLMDALRRGCAVVTTPVGQTDRLVVNGVNGWVCHSEDEMRERLAELADDPDLLYRLRLGALACQQDRGDAVVREQLLGFLTERRNANVA